MSIELTPEELDSLPRAQREKELARIEAEKQAMAQDAQEEVAEPEAKVIPLPLETEPAQDAPAGSETPAPSDAGQAAQAEPTELAGLREQVRVLEAQKSTLAGKLNAEIPRMARELAEQKAKETALMQRMEAMEQQMQAAAPKRTAKEEYDLSDEEAQFEEGVNIATKVMTKAEQRLRQEFQRELEKVRQPAPAQAVEQTEQQADPAVAAFYSDLSQAVPDWQTINANPVFHSWLGQTDSTTGATRQALLTEAENAGNGARAGRILAAFKADQAAQVAAQQKAAISAQAIPGKDRGRTIEPVKKAGQRPDSEWAEIRRNWSKYSEEQREQFLKEMG